MQKKTSLGFRLQQLENFILETVHEQKKNRLDKLKNFITVRKTHTFETQEAARMISIHESAALIKRIKKFTELNIFDFYKKLFNDKNYFRNLAKGITLPENINDIIDFTVENLKGDYLTYDDALAIAFFRLSVNGCDEYKNIKQVLIDEAQDYDPIHFEILNQLFPKSRFTVLGDINQTVGAHKDLSLYQQIEQILCKSKSILVTMDKSFRCTNEILNYSAKFIDENIKIESFNRSGEMPAVFTAQNLSALDEIIELCTKKGYHSIAMICKTEKDALSLNERLKDKIDIQLITDTGSIDVNGAFIIPLTLSKGLEFDAVLICDADRRHYSIEEDKNLLYIACSRALHRLNLFYIGEKSPLL
jgi:DNA helicase-2/ATP-dependent DNA helicase PcrA